MHLKYKRNSNNSLKENSQRRMRVKLVVVLKGCKERIMDKIVKILVRLWEISKVYRV